jgi:hypothetical protein
MLLLDTSFLVEFEDELANRRRGGATTVLPKSVSSACRDSTI